MLRLARSIVPRSSIALQNQSRTLSSLSLGTGHTGDGHNGNGGTHSAHPRFSQQKALVTKQLKALQETTRQLEEFQRLLSLNNKRSIHDEKPILDSEIKDIVDVIILHHAVSFSRLENGSFCVYYTSNDLRTESTAFLTPRGYSTPVVGWHEDSQFYRHEAPVQTINHPVSPGSVITRRQMYSPGILNAEYVLLFESSSKFVARAVEDEIQRRLMHLPLGCRLFRRVAPRAKPGPPDGKVHKVGLIFSPELPKMIDSGDIILRNNAAGSGYLQY